VLQAVKRAHQAKAACRTTLRPGCISQGVTSGVSQAANNRA